MTMKSTCILLSAALLSGLMLGQARAECQIADAKLEEAILHQANLRGSANRQSVRDLRRLRDAALVLQSYGRDGDCERLVGNRSEERRVGKKCRSRWSRTHDKRKKNDRTIIM